MYKKIKGLVDNLSPLGFLLLSLFLFALAIQSFFENSFEIGFWQLLGGLGFIVSWYLGRLFLQVVKGYRKALNEWGETLDELAKVTKNFSEAQDLILLLSIELKKRRKRRFETD